MPLHPPPADTMPNAWRLALFLAPMLPLLEGCAPGPPADVDDPSFRTWEVYHGDKAGTHYSSLSQIDVENVHQLQVAWTFSTGDLTERRSEIQCNPIVVRGLFYCTTAQGKAFALDAATGDPLWVYDPFARTSGSGPGTNRGVVHWEDESGDGRIFVVGGSFLHAVDAMTGEPIEEFGTAGMIDLRDGLGRDASDLYVTSNTPGIIYGDLLIQGTRVGESLPAAPGHIRAYDVRTGEIRWIFHTVPQPGEYGYETWPPDAHAYIGGANNWAGMSLDEERGIVFVPTGSAAFDFHGGNRLGDNLFANSVIALNAATGERIWHYQTVRHDIWDYDLPAPPNLVRIRRDRGWIDAVAQVTKTGHIFIFDRDTGEPLFPIEEVDVAPSDLVGEVVAATQPLPIVPAPFHRQEFTEEMVTRITPESHAAVLARFRQARTGGTFIPPSVEGTVVFPGFNGGAEWGGAAYDVETGVLYVNSTEMPWIMTMVGIPPEDEDPSSIGSRVYTLNCASCHGADRGGDAQGTFPSLRNVEDRYGREEIAAIIAEGRGYMPSFGHLSAENRDALVSFLLDPADSAPGTSAREIVDESGGASVPYTHTGYHRFLDPDGYPAIEPPWGTLNAIDLSTGEYLWTVRLGEFEELTAAGIPQTGTENYGGPVITAGGLLFIGATPDEKFRAFDKRTGELLWETRLPAGGYATPATYEIEGKQYVVIAAGGGKMGTPSGDRYVAFTLPD